MKYSLSNIAQICRGTLIGRDVVVESVSTDSRSFFGANENSLFVAIGGCNHDGHGYINELYSRGVRAFVVEQDVALDGYADAGFVVVESSVGALQSLAADYRGRFNGTVVAVAGSNGKTIVKEWIWSLAPVGIKIFRSPKSYNSQIGVPLSILMMAGDEDVVVIEAGISKPWEMERLERIIRPEIVVLTTIGDAHQENFVSIDQKISEKLLLAKGAKHIIFNSHHTDLAAAIRKSYPNTKQSDSAAQTEVYGFFKDQTSQENAAAAATVWDTLGYDHAATISLLGELQTVAMRLELKEGVNNSLIINDSYNSDINSLALALDYLKSVAGEKPQMLILSDILQSGLEQRELYDKVAKMVALSGVSRFVGIGWQISQFSELFGGNGEFWATTKDFIDNLPAENLAGKAILLKGNHNSQFDKIGHLLELKSHTTTLEVDLDAMIHNLEQHRTLLDPTTKIMAMVKAGGYGNGNYEIANMLQGKGVDYLAVAYADEGVELRRLGISMAIVVLNADADSFDLMVRHRLEPEIYSFGSLRSFAAAIKRHSERRYPIHIKVDTGMHRLGFDPLEVDLLGDELLKYGEMVKVSTIFSHLAASDDPSQDEFTNRQIATFDRFSTTLCATLPYRPLRHISNSSAIERLPYAQFDMVRLGIGLYGVGKVNGVSMTPVSTLRTRIVQIKSYDAPDTVGYGRAGKIVKPSRIATIPVGYADGLNRKLGEGRWAMVVANCSAPIIGRICMDACMIDITGIDAREGDEVVIFGSKKGHTIADMARVLDTIPYEIMTSVSGRVKRIYSKE